MSRFRCHEDYKESAEPVGQRACYICKGIRLHCRRRCSDASVLRHGNARQRSKTLSSEDGTCRRRHPCPRSCDRPQSGGDDVSQNPSHASPPQLNRTREVCSRAQPNNHWLLPSLSVSRRSHIIQGNMSPQAVCTALQPVSRTESHVCLLHRFAHSRPEAPGAPGEAVAQQ